MPPWRQNESYGLNGTQLSISTHCPLLDPTMPDPFEARAAADLTVRLRDDFAAYDFVMPALAPAAFPPPPVPAGAAPGTHEYRQLLERMAGRVARPLSGPEHPLRRETLLALLDAQVRRHLPAGTAPTAGQALQVLGQPSLLAQVAQAAAASLHGDAAPVRLRRLSEIAALPMRRDRSVAVDKCIYPRLPLAHRDDARERGLLAWVQDDDGVEAFCRLDDRHAALHAGDPDAASPWRAPPDFLVRTGTAVYLVDLHPRRDAARRLQTTMAWCERLNALPPAWRGERAWFFAPLAGRALDDWQRHNGRLAELLAFARIGAGYVARAGCPGWSA